MKITYFKGWRRPEPPMRGIRFAKGVFWIGQRGSREEPRTTAKVFCATPERSACVGPIYPRFTAPIRILSRVVSKAVSSFARKGRR